MTSQAKLKEHDRESKAYRTIYDAGLTLVETLVVIGVLGLISLALSGSIGFGAQVWSRSEVRTADLYAIHAAQNFLRSRLEQLTFKPRADKAPKPGETIENTRRRFAGAGNQLFFHSILRGAPGFGGYHSFNLRLRQNNMEIEWNLADIYRSNGLKSRVEILLRDVDRMEISYFGDKLTKAGKHENPDWHNSWDGRDGLPLLIRIRLQRRTSSVISWPEFVVAPIVNPGIGIR